MRLATAGLAACLLLGPVLPAAAAGSCPSQIRAAQHYVNRLGPGPNTREAQRYLNAAKRARTQSQCVADLRKVDYYARRSAAADRRSTHRTSGYGSSIAPAAKCADALHQSRPGGSDYHGRPVPGCR
jgi:hypothetical protein